MYGDTLQHTKGEKLHRNAVSVIDLEPFNFAPQSIPNHSHSQTISNLLNVYCLLKVVQSVWKHSSWPTRFYPVFLEASWDFLRYVDLLWMWILFFSGYLEHSKIIYWRSKLSQRLFSPCSTWTKQIKLKH